MLNASVKINIYALLMRPNKQRRAMVRREDTWAEAADVLPRLFKRIAFVVAVASVCFMAAGFCYVMFFQGKTFTLPTVPTSTSNAVKSEY